jgi:glycosyltransferase involved in cell wall biosynthesis
MNAWSMAHDLDDKFVFLYAGTLGLKHNPELLVKLAERFAHDRAVRVVVVSEGPGADFLRVRKQQWRLDNLVVLPFQPFAAVADMHGSADVLVAVLEPDAGRFSVPSKVLSYHCAGRALLAAVPPENLAARTIAAAGSGLVVEPAAVTRFISAAARLRADEMLRTSLARRGRAYAEEHFHLGRITDRFETVLRTALAGGRVSVEFPPDAAAVVSNPLEAA